MPCSDTVRLGMIDACRLLVQSPRRAPAICRVWQIVKPLVHIVQVDTAASEGACDDGRSDVLLWRGHAEIPAVEWPLTQRLPG
jgi:hypothetical protein